MAVRSNAKLLPDKVFNILVDGDREPAKWREIEDELLGSTLAKGASAKGVGAGSRDTLCGCPAFYDRLFGMDLEIRSSFASDMEEQSRKLMQRITIAMQSLKDLNQMVPPPSVI